MHYNASNLDVHAHTESMAHKQGEGKYTVLCIALNVASYIALKSITQLRSRRFNIHYFPVRYCGAMRPIPLHTLCSTMKWLMRCCVAICCQSNQKHWANLVSLRQVAFVSWTGPLYFICTGLTGSIISADKLLSVLGVV